MGKAASQTAKTELVAFHAAAWRAAQDSGRQHETISVPEWEGLLVDCLGTMTRQSCQDKTWALERMKLIRRLDRQGVVLLPPQVNT